MDSVELDVSRLRAMLKRGGEFDVLAINDLSDPKALAVLFKYDSIQGR